MVTPSADVRAPSRFTPLIQAYWVRALRVRVAMCFGIVGNKIDREGIRSIGLNGVRAVVVLDEVAIEGGGKKGGSCMGAE